MTVLWWEPSSNMFGDFLLQCQKILLVSVMAGLETVPAFMVMYEIPLLQILGVPMTFITLYPIISGPSAIIMLNLLGRLIDQGANHRTRKIVAVILNASMTLIGFLLIIVSNMITLPRESTKNTTVNIFEECLNKNGEAANICTNGLRKDDSFVPVAGVLGLIGVMTMDMGYDVNLGTSRACVLACSSSSNHRVLLVLALVMAALGGCVFNSLGLVDFSQAFDLGVAGQGSLIAQSTAQLVGCCLLLFVTTTVTVTIALFNIRRNLDSSSYTLIEESHPLSKQEQDYHSCLEDENPTTQDIHHGCRSQEIDNGRRDSSSIWMNLSTKEDSNVSNNLENHPTCKSDCDLNSASKSASSFTPRIPRPIQKIMESICNTSSSPNVSPEADTGGDVSQTGNDWKYWQWNQHRLNFLAAFLTGYLASSSYFTYNFFVLDFMGKVVMGGDSMAPHHSAEFQAYSRGVSLGSRGQLAFYCCYLVINICHNKLLDFWGLKVDFCLSQLLTAVSIVSLLLSRQVPVYYVCCVVFSLQRAVAYSVPYIIASKYIREEEKAGRTVAGRSMALMACVVPLANCTAFLVCGPLVHVTQHPGAPLLLSSVCASLGALVFFGLCQL